MSRLRTAAVIAAVVILASCNGGQRPTLVIDEAPTPLPELQIELPPAPAGTPPLPPASPDFPLSATVDDALLAWAADRNVAYIDSCSLVVPGPGQLCDVETTRETVRLLGPSSVELWYIVSVAEVPADFGTGYRVASVDVAG